MRTVAQATALDASQFQFGFGESDPGYPPVLAAQSGLVATSEKFYGIFRMGRRPRSKPSITPDELLSWIE